MTTSDRSPGASPETPEQLLAAAVSGDRHALVRLVAEPPPEVGRHRLGPALARRAVEAGLEPPPAWRDALRGTAAVRLGLEATMARLAEAFGEGDEAGIPWLPIKGCDLGSRVYPAREDRPTSDLDVLVAADRFADARSTLAEAGFEPLASGPLAERYMGEEGYAWQARALAPDGTPGCLVELHGRLWGSVPEAMAEEILDRSIPAPELGPTARRPSLPDAYLIAAVHAWLHPPPRSLNTWWDLERIALPASGVPASRVPAGAAPADGDTASSGTFAARVADAARSLGLQLPVVLAARETATLFAPSRAPHERIVRELAGDLRWAERRLVERQAARGSDAVGLASLTLARLLAGRPSRAGWRSAVRRVWSHPGVVAAETSADRPWIVRRLRHLAGNLGLTPGSRELPRSPNPGERAAP